MPVASHLLLLAAAAALLFSPALGAGVPVTSADLAAGRAPLVACDGDGFALGYSSNSAGQLTAMHIGGIHANCAGGTIHVTLLAGSSVVASTSAELPSSGFTGSIDLGLSALPLAPTISRAQMAVEGR